MAATDTKISPLPAATLEQVSDADLARYAELIYRRTGIRISPHKKTLLSNRLRRRLKQTGINTFGKYLQHLKRLPQNDPEWDAFLQEITTHETYLFRDESQWDWFRNTFLPECAAKARREARRRELRIWSAACSTGDEPFTAACCIAACLPNHQQWKIEILGTDVGTGALEQAKAAVFGERAMRLVPESYRRRFFTKARDANIWQACPVLTGMVRFRQHNLINPLRGGPFDLVLLKNVLIYFDTASKVRVLENVEAVIRPGGRLICGPTEGVGGLLPDFNRINPWLFCKPAQRSRSAR